MPITTTITTTTTVVGGLGWRGEGVFDTDADIDTDADPEAGGEKMRRVGRRGLQGRRIMAAKGHVRIGVGVCIGRRKFLAADS
jgi:hypothetical protein